LSFKWFSGIFIKTKLDIDMFGTHPKTEESGEIDGDG